MYKIVLFGVDGCPDCEEQKRILNKNYEGNWTYVDIDSHIASEQELMAKYEIFDPPSLLIIKRTQDGKSRVFRHVGIISASKMNKFIDRF